MTALHLTQSHARLYKSFFLYLSALRLILTHSHSDGCVRGNSGFTPLPRDPSKQTRGARDQTPVLLTGRRPVLPSEI